MSNRGRWDERKHPRDNQGQFTEAWAQRISDAIDPPKSKSNRIDEQPPVPGDDFLEMRMAMGGESEEPAQAIVDNIDHYRNRTEVYNPETGQWGVLGDAWLREENDDSYFQDTMAFTLRGGAGYFQLYIENEGDDFGTVRIRPIPGESR